MGHKKTATNNKIFVLKSAKKALTTLKDLHRSVVNNFFVLFGTKILLLAAFFWCPLFTLVIGDHVGGLDLLTIVYR